MGLEGSRGLLLASFNQNDVGTFPLSSGPKYAGYLPALTIGTGSLARTLICTSVSV